MCQGQHKANDEVWETSSTEGETDCDSESEQTRAQPPRRAPLGTPAVATKVAPGPPAAARVAAAPAAHAPHHAGGIARAVPMPMRGVPDPAAVPSQMARQVVSNAQAGGLMTLVSHLRADNSRLREALVAAQRETEALIETQMQAPAGADFGHLLELIRDFGDVLGGEDTYSSEPAPDGLASGAQVFSLDSPRGEHDGSEDVSDLRMELEASRLEVARLRQELAAKDAALAAAGLSP